MTESESQAFSTAAPGPAAEVGALARIPGALFSPTKTFESIARRPSWLAPLLIWVVFSVVATSIVVPKMDLERMIRERLEKSGQTVSEERIQEIVQRQKSISGVIAYVIAGVVPAILSLLVALVIWGAFKAFGWDATFPQSFGATTHAFLPGVLGSILLIPILLSRESIDPRAMGDLLRSNLGFLVERDSSKLLHSLLGSLDLFSIWSLALFVIGFAAAAKVGRKQAAAVIVTLWFVYVLGKAGWAAAFG